LQAEADPKALEEDWEQLDYMFKLRPYFDKAKRLAEEMQGSPEPTLNLRGRPG
jgi:hypothetical protein